MPLFDDLSIVSAADDDMHHLTESLVGADSDEILIWDVSEGGYRKIKRSNLIKNLTIYGLSLADFLEVSEVALPANPAADKQRIWLTAGGLLNIVDELGVVKNIVLGPTVSVNHNFPQFNGVAGAIEDSLKAVPAGDVVGTSDTQQLSNKTIDGYFDINEEAAPGTPGAGVGRLYYKADHKLYRKDDGGIELEIGAGGGAGGINYCDNPDAETNTTGWVVYDDGAVAVPVNGTGGAPDSTFTRDTTSTALLLPLRGSACFLWDAGAAANRQGEGISYDFTIDPIDQTKICRLSFDWMANQVVAEGDFIVYIYDVTNAVLIQPTPFRFPGTVSDAKCSWSGEFQAAYNSVNYRFIMHRAIATAQDFNLWFDNFKFGPQDMKQGVPVTDWVSYIPTGTWLVNTMYTGKWRRVGDSLEMEVQVRTSGAPTAVPLSVGLPSGFVIDITKLPTDTLNGNYSVNGFCNSLDAGMQLYNNGPIGYTSTTMVGCRYNNGAGTSADITEAAPFAYGAGDSVWIKAKVPILGWSSNVQVSSDAETRVVEASAYRITTALTITAGAAIAVIVFNALRKDTHGAFAIDTGLYTVKVPGIYKVSYGCMVLCGGTAPSEVGLSVNKNGAAESRGVCYRSDLTASKNATFSGIAEIECVAGDTLGVYAYSSGQNVTITNSGGTNDTSYINIHRISGPSQIAASEKVYAEYNTAAGQLLTNTVEAVVDFGTKVSDSHGAVTTGAAWKFTAPRASFYNIVVGLMLLENAGAFDGTTESFSCNIYKGVVNIYSKYYVPPASVVYPAVGVLISTYLNAGEYIQIKAMQNCGSNKNLFNDAKYCYVMISSQG